MHVRVCDRIDFLLLKTEKHGRQKLSREFSGHSLRRGKSLRLTALYRKILKIHFSKS